jgi:plasmid maintenance system antidote protein VapI
MIYPLQSIMDKLQINKSDLAKFIGISKTYMSEVANGQRHLNDEQIIQLNTLYHLAFKTEDNPAFVKNLLIQENLALKDELEQTNQLLKEEVEQLQARLQDMEAQHLKALVALEKLDSLTRLNKEMSAEHLQWVENLRAYWRKMTPRIDHSQQHRLQVRIQCCLAEMECNSNKISQL